MTFKSKQVPKFSLKPEVLQQIGKRKNKDLKRALCDLFEIDRSTLWQWRKQNHPNLTRRDSLQLIAVYLKEDDIENLLQEGVEEYMI